MTPFSLSGLLIVAASTTIALIVLLHQPHRTLNRAYALFFGTVTIWGLCAFLIGFRQKPETAFLLWKLSNVGIAFIPVLWYRVVYLLCNLQNRKALIAVYLFGVVSSLLTFSWLLSAGVRPLFGFYYFIAGPLYPLYFLVWVGIVSLAHYELWKRHRVVNSVERKRLQLLFLGVMVGFLGGTLNFLPIFGIDIYPWGNFTIPIAALIQVYAIFVYKLMDVKIVVRKALIYSTLAALITATYLVMVLIMEHGFQGFFGYRSLIATLFVAFLIAIFFDPIRNRIQMIVDHALFKATPPELAEQRDHLLTEVRRGEQMKAVGTLAAGLAHEIKNPLAAIKTFTEHLDTRYDDPGFRAKFQKIVGSEVERINLIVQQLLDFAKPVPPKLTPLEVPKLLDETLDFLNNEFLQRHVEIQRHYAATGMILGDPQQLKQVFLNLFLNSLDAMNGAGELDIATTAHGAELLVTITDDGAGIEPKDLPHLFEPFFTTKPTGTGLGLAIVQSLVQEHGGRVTVESQPNQGTSFTLHFPLAAD